MKPIRKIAGALALLVLFVAYQVSVTAFTHVHYINGVLIAHSHPFQGEHSHTKSEVIVIGRLSTFESPAVEAYVDMHPMRALLAVMVVKPVTSASKGEVIRTHSLRAPPALAA